MCFAFSFNFWFSMVWLFLTYLCAEGWMSPAVAMIQISIDVRYKGVAMGVFLFATAIFGTVGTLVIGTIVEDFHIQSQAKKGWLIALNTAVPCLISSILFYISSIHFLKFKQKVQEDKTEALAKASNYVFSETASVQNYGHFYPKKDRSPGSISNEYEFKSGTDFTVVKKSQARP